MGKIMKRILLVLSMLGLGASQAAQGMQVRCKDVEALNGLIQDLSLSPDGQLEAGHVGNVLIVYQIKLPGHPMYRAFRFAREIKGAWFKDNTTIHVITRGGVELDIQIA